MEPHTELYNQLFNQATLMHYQRAQQSTEPLVVGEFNKAVFDDRYQRNNKRGGLKNLRCFPSHSAEHRERGFCGQPVVVKVKRTHANVVIPEIYCWSEFVKVDDASAASVKAGDRVSHNQVLSVERDKDDRTRPWMRGELVHDDTTDDCIAFEFNRQRWGWHYSWVSNKHACNNSHALQCYVFQPVSPGSDTLVCLAVFQSPHFILYCRRRRRFKNKHISAATDAATTTAVVSVGNEAVVQDKIPPSSNSNSQNDSMPCSPEGAIDVTKVMKVPESSSLTSSSSKKKKAATSKKTTLAVAKKDKKRKSSSSTTATTKTKAKKPKKDKGKIVTKSKSKKGEKKSKKIKSVAVTVAAVGQQQQHNPMDNLTQWTTAGQQQHQAYQHQQMMMMNEATNPSATLSSNDAQAASAQTHSGPNMVQRLPDYHYQYQQQQQQQHLQQLLQQQHHHHHQQQQQQQQHHVGLAELDDPSSDLRSALDLSSANNQNNNISSFNAQDTHDKKSSASASAAAAALSGHGHGMGMGIGLNGMDEWMKGPVSNADPFEASFDAWTQHQQLQQQHQQQQQQHHHDTPPSTCTATPSVALH